MTLDQITASPWLLWGLVVVVIVAFALRMPRRHSSRDPRRMFSEKERAAGFARARSQCEFARWGFFRCTRTASHGDHYIPWSRGGATTMRNFVAACATCNTTKGAATPTSAERALMAMRRRRYFPAGIPLDAGEWCLAR